MSKTEILKIFLIFLNIGIVLELFALFSLREYVRTKWNSLVRYINLVIAATLTLLFAQYTVYADARYIEPNWIKVEKVNIRNEKFSPELRKLKIVHLTDLHIKKNGFRERSLISKVNAIKPDLILITGDFLTDRAYIPDAVSVISRLRASKGIYGVFGNHDHDLDIPELRMALDKVGVRILDNESVRVPISGEDGLWLIGFDNIWTKEISAELIQKAYNGVNLLEPNIVLIHYPEAIESEYISSDNADLVLAGDTHGGQVGLSKLRNMSMFEVEHPYVAGLFYVKGVPLYVNRGIGMRRKDLRFSCRPEIALITLSKHTNTTSQVDLRGNR